LRIVRKKSQKEERAKEIPTTKEECDKGCAASGGPRALGGEKWNIPKEKPGDEKVTKPTIYKSEKYLKIEKVG